MSQDNPGQFNQWLTRNKRDWPKGRKAHLPDSYLTRKAKEIERIKGVRYLDRKREKDPPWGYSR